LAISPSAPLFGYHWIINDWIKHFLSSRCDDRTMTLTKHQKWNSLDGKMIHHTCIFNQGTLTLSTKMRSFCLNRAIVALKKRLQDYDCCNDHHNHNSFFLASSRNRWVKGSKNMFSFFMHLSFTAENLSQKFSTFEVAKKLIFPTGKVSLELIISFMILNSTLEQTTQLGEQALEIH